LADGNATTRSLPCLACEAPAKWLDTGNVETQRAPGWSKTVTRVVTECPTHGVRSRLRMVLELDEGQAGKRYVG
jgi:hypothetical protein